MREWKRRYSVVRLARTGRVAYPAMFLTALTVTAIGPDVANWMKILAPFVH